MTIFLPHIYSPVKHEAGRRRKNFVCLSLLDVSYPNFFATLREGRRFAQRAWPERAAGNIPGWDGGAPEYRTGLGLLVNGMLALPESPRTL